MPHNRHSALGIVIGIFVVACFAMTLPITRYLFTLDLSVWDIGLGRSLLGSICALMILIATKQKFPDKKYLPKLLMIGIAAAFGFTLLTTYGTRTVLASNGGVIIAANGISAALFARLFSSERPSWQFWSSAFAGFFLIVLFSYLSNGGVNVANLYYGELALMCAVVMAGISHTVGSVLAKEIGSWQVICWAMVLVLPVLLPLSLLTMDFSTIIAMKFWGWHHLLFLGIINNCLVFVMWYHAMLLGGIAKIAQLQLLQPFITLLVAVTLLGELFNPLVVIFMVLMVIVVAFGQRSHVGSHVGNHAGIDADKK